MHSPGRGLRGPGLPASCNRSFILFMTKHALLFLCCMFLVACEYSSSKNNASTNKSSQTIANNDTLRVTIGTDGITSQTATITNPDNTETDVTQVANWVSADETVAVVLEPGLIQGVAPGTTNVDVFFQGATIDTFEVTVLAVLPADITWFTLSDWAVFRDGPNGFWTLLQRDPVSGNYLFTVTDPDALFAVAEIYQSPFGMNRVDIAYLMVDDLENNTLSTNSSALATNVTINVTGAQATDQGFLTSYDFTDSQYYWAPNYSMDIQPTGFYAETSDLLANVFETDANGNRLSTHFFRQNDVAFFDNMSTSIDIRGPLSFTPDIEQTTTVVGVNGEEDFIYLDTDFTTANGSLLKISRRHVEGSGQEIVGPVTMISRGVPQLEQRAGDMHHVIATAAYLDGVRVSKIISETIHGSHNITLPQPMLATDLTWEFLNTGDNLQSRFSWTNHQDAEFGAADYYTILLRHITSDVSWNIKIDPLWLDAVAMTIDTPDFSSISGWDSAFNISEGYATFARLQAYHSNVDSISLLRDGMLDGVVINRLSLSQTQFP